MAKRKPELTPISYLKVHQVSGYTRKDGRHIEPYLRSTWVVEFPVPLKSLDLEDFGSEKFPPREAIEPARKVTKEPAAQEWSPVADYVLSLYDEYDFFELQDAIYRKNEDGDVISMTDGLVWEKELKTRNLEEAGLEEVYLVRVWTLLYNRNRDEHFVFARARSLLLSPERMRQSLESAYEACLEIYDGLVQWAEESTDYIEVRKMLAWTVWGRPLGQNDGEKAPKKSS